MVTVTLDEILDRLNSALEADRKAVSYLITHKICCNDKLADHPTVQCGMLNKDQYTIGMLGIINGIIGIKDDGYGYICANIDENGIVLEFVATQSKE